MAVRDPSRSEPQLELSPVRTDVPQNKVDHPEGTIMSKHHPDSDDRSRRRHRAVRRWTRTFDRVLRVLILVAALLGALVGS